MDAIALPSLWHARGRAGNALDNAGLPRCMHPDNNSASRLLCNKSCVQITLRITVANKREPSSRKSEASVPNENYSRHTHLKQLCTAGSILLEVFEELLLADTLADYNCRQCIDQYRNRIHKKCMDLDSSVHRDGTFFRCTDSWTQLRQKTGNKERNEYYNR